MIAYPAREMNWASQSEEPSQVSWRKTRSPWSRSINSSGLRCKSSLFADDVSLRSSHDDIDTIAEDMNADLSLILHFDTVLKLPFLLLG